MLSGFFLESSSLVSLSIFPQLQVGSSITGPRVSRLSANEVKAAIQGINHEDSLERGDRNRFNEIMDLTIIGLEKIRTNFKAKQFLGIWQEVSKRYKSKSQNTIKGLVKLGILIQKKFKKISYEILLGIQNTNIKKNNIQLVEIPEISNIIVKQKQQTLSPSQLNPIPIPPLYKISISNIFSACNIISNVQKHKMINVFQCMKLNNRLVLSIQLSSQILLFLIKQRQHEYYREVIQNLKQNLLLNQQKITQNVQQITKIQIIKQIQNENQKESLPNNISNINDCQLKTVQKQQKISNPQKYIPAKQFQICDSKEMFLFKDDSESYLNFGVFHDSALSKNMYHLQCDQFFQSIQDIACKQGFFRQQNHKQHCQNISSISPQSLINTKSVEKIESKTSSLLSGRSLSKVKNNKQNYSKLKDSSKYADMQELIARSQIMSQINGRERTKSGKAYYVNPFIVTKSQVQLYNRKARNI